MAFDGIVTKAIASELQNLSGARIDKIFQPTKNNILIGMYSKGENHLLNISIDSGNYRIHLTKNPKPNPKIAYNFCMVLRKHLLGLSFKNVITSNLERIITIEFEGFDDIDDIISKKLIIELMGKHCNIILLDSHNVIIDSLRHINNENSDRIIVPHSKYIFPKISKNNILDFYQFEDFYNKLETLKLNFLNDISILNIICNNFNGLSTSFLNYHIESLNTKTYSYENIQKIHSLIFDIISKTETDSNQLTFANIMYKKGDSTTNLKSEYVLDYDFNINSNHNLTSTSSKILLNNFKLNYILDDIYYQKESKEEFKNYRDTVLKIILDILKKYTKRLDNINDKLKTCDNINTYKLYGELLTANLYKFTKNDTNKNNLNEIQLENYYDNNSTVLIKLDPRYSISQNTKNYFKKYNKLKNTLEIVGQQKIDTFKELEYIQSIVYSLENSSTLTDISEIYEEISEHIIFKENARKNATSSNNKNKFKKSNSRKSKLIKNKSVTFNPIKYDIHGYTFLVGRNNKENDYLTLKYANSKDLWFHTKDIPGSHCILILSHKNTYPSDDILYKCAQLAAKHSKAKNSSNTPVDICEVKYVKKPNKSKPGMVIYTNNKTFYV